MKKQEAISRLGGSVREAANAIGISAQAIYDWPEELTDAISDRVIAAQVRLMGCVPPAPIEVKQPKPNGAV